MGYGSERFSGNIGLLRLASARAAARSFAAMGPGNHRGDGMRRRTSLATAVAGGLLLAGSLPPWPRARGAWPLGLVGAALVFVALDRDRWRDRLPLRGGAGGG